MPFENISYISMIQSLFESVYPNLSYEIFEAFARDLPDIIEEDAIYLIPGSRSDAWSDAPWMVELRSFIEELHKEKAKMIGISFGHQLIAETLGGRVEKAVAGYGLGVRESEFCDAAITNHFKSGKLSLHYFHQDQVVILPPESKPLATSSFCSTEGFTIGKHVITVQGHPEYDSTYMRYVLKNHSYNISEIMRIKAIKTLQEETNGLEVVKYMFNFLGII